VQLLNEEERKLVRADTNSPNAESIHNHLFEMEKACELEMVWRNGTLNAAQARLAF